MAQRPRGSGEGAGIYRDGPAKKDPCEAQRAAYDAAVAAQRVTQRALSTVNSAAREREVMASHDESVIKAWKKEVKAATTANNKAVEQVNKTFAKLTKCEKKPVS